MAGATAVDAGAGAAVAQTLPIARAAIRGARTITASDASRAVHHAVAGALMSGAGPLARPTVETAATLSVEALGTADDAGTDAAVGRALPGPIAAISGRATLTLGQTDTIADHAGAVALVLDTLPAVAAAVRSLTAGRSAVVAGPFADLSFAGALEVRAAPLASATVLGQTAVSAGRRRSTATLGTLIGTVEKRLVTGVEASIAPLGGARVDVGVPVVAVCARRMTIAVSVVSATHTAPLLADLSRIRADDILARIALDAGAAVTDRPFWADDRRAGIIAAHALAFDAEPPSWAALRTSLFDVSVSTRVRLLTKPSPFAGQEKADRKTKKKDTKFRQATSQLHIDSILHLF